MQMRRARLSQALFLGIGLAISGGAMAQAAPAASAARDGNPATVTPGRGGSTTTVTPGRDPSGLPASALPPASAASQAPARPGVGRRPATPASAIIR